MLIRSAFPSSDALKIRSAQLCALFLWADAMSRYANLLADGVDESAPRINLANISGHL